ncbi:hypothetical protein ACCO45_013288 [Purpureocillium lilacinum]|uniref:Uncharacterized protein n=1 Tax=Purpureocillium lilacinum TaxID=33203 RepID=A0ACC4DDG0_PURLI
MDRAGGDDESTMGPVVVDDGGDGGWGRWCLFGGAAGQSATPPRSQVRPSPPLPRIASVVASTRGWLAAATTPDVLLPTANENGRLQRNGSLAQSRHSVEPPRRPQRSPTIFFLGFGLALQTRHDWLLYDACNCQSRFVPSNVAAAASRALPLPPACCSAKLNLHIMPAALQHAGEATPDGCATTNAGHDPALAALDWPAAPRSASCLEPRVNPACRPRSPLRSKARPPGRLAVDAVHADRCFVPAGSAMA